MSVAAIAHTTSTHMPRPASSQISMDKTTSVATNPEDKTANGSTTLQPDSRTRTNNGAGVKTETADDFVHPARPGQSQPGEKGAHLSREPNPFEQSFGSSSAEVPTSKSLLPPVASLTSPAPLAGDVASTGGFSYPNSLRAGPLSPAMLGGPVGASDYFDPSLRGTSFTSGVTPNESSLRTGLTPGGGGSMFPAPSPNTQALLNQLAGGGATPGTLDFHRTAMNAATASKNNSYRTNGSSSTQSEEKKATVAVMDPALQDQPPPASFEQHEGEAANGLLMFSQAGGTPQANGSFMVPSTANAPSQMVRSQDTSPTMTQRLQNGNMSDPTQGPGDEDSADDGKPTTRSRGKKNGSKNSSQSNGRRKAEDTPMKQPPSKKAKAHIMMEEEDDESDDQGEMPDTHPDGKKMTDEEKRKNFLERNRVAALKCRQRKKQWLQNLQAKCEMFSGENEALQTEVRTLRDEIMGLKAMLLQHRECPVSQNTGMSNFFAQQDFGSHNPYGTGMQHGQQVMAGQRR